MDCLNGDRRLGFGTKIDSPITVVIDTFLESPVLLRHAAAATENPADPFHRISLPFQFLSGIFVHLFPVVPTKSRYGQVCNNGSTPPAATAARENGNKEYNPINEEIKAKIKHEKEGRREKAIHLVGPLHVDSENDATAEA